MDTFLNGIEHHVTDPTMAMDTQMEFFLYDNGVNYHSDRNISSPANVTQKFFDVYYSMPRFVIESSMALAAVTANIFTMVLLYNGSRKQKGTAYRILFYNLSAANTLCCILSWMANNSLLIFQQHFVNTIKEPEGLCHVYLYLMAAMFASVAFGIESSITMLGFTAIQYRSVSRPLVHWALTRQNMGFMFLVTSWILTFLFGCVPFGILLGMTNAHYCTQEMQSHALNIVIIGATLATALEGAIYIVIITLSVSIYAKLQHYGKGFWNIRFENQIKTQKRIFGTTLMLFVTLVIFSLPYMILYVVTLNEKTMSHIQESTLIHYMNILPYFKFLIDPIIYGMRMHEVKYSCFRLMTKCGLECNICARNKCQTPRSPPRYLMHHVTFV